MGRVQVRGVNIEGDEQADRENHGGRTKQSTLTPTKTMNGSRPDTRDPFCLAILVKT